MITRQIIKIQMLLVKPSNFPPQEFSCFEFSFGTAALSRLPPNFSVKTTFEPELIQLHIKK
jgi:hypothetical protein